MSHIHWVPRQNKLEYPEIKMRSTSEKSTNAVVYYESIKKKNWVTMW